MVWVYGSGYGQCEVGFARVPSRVALPQLCAPPTTSPLSLLSRARPEKEFWANNIQSTAAPSVGRECDLSFVPPRKIPFRVSALSMGFRVTG